MKLYSLSKGGTIAFSKSYIAPNRAVSVKSSMQDGGRIHLSQSGGAVASIKEQDKNINLPIQNTEQLQSKLSHLSQMSVKRNKSGKPTFVRL